MQTNGDIKMATFQIIKGKALANAIAGRAKQVATFKEREHQLAASALTHLDAHNDACYVQALYEVTPRNYRAGLVKWATAFGKCKFDAKAEKFEYRKGKSDMEAAMKIAPADYVKETKKADAKKPEFDLVAKMESLIEKAEEVGTDHATLSAMHGVIRLHKAAMEKAAKEVAAEAEKKAEKKAAKKADNVHPIPGTVVLRAATPEAVAA
tara:strand:- start:597 stop:1223 length:627 start_codon:yes stop_codon:yes gene_type:complete